MFHVSYTGLAVIMDSNNNIVHRMTACTITFATHDNSIPASYITYGLTSARPVGNYYNNPNLLIGSCISPVLTAQLINQIGNVQNSFGGVSLAVNQIPSEYIGNANYYLGVLFSNGYIRSYSALNNTPGGQTNYLAYDKDNNQLHNISLPLTWPSTGNLDAFCGWLDIGDNTVTELLPTGSMLSFSFKCNTGTTNYIYYYSSNNANYTREFFLNYAKPDVSNADPYEPGGTSGGGGGSGDFDGTGDSIGIPSLPTLSAADTGFITLYNPSISQLRSLANYMWSNPLFDLDAWKKIFANPMDAVLGLSIVPVAVPSGSAQAVTIGNISTGISLTTAASQYVEIDCGTLNVNEFWGAYLDYDPYTKAEIYLPYCGTHALATDDIMDKPVHVVYHVDILSGSCVAFVSCGGTVLYTFTGQCSCSIPITGDNWTNVINGAISIAASIGSMVATDGASAPMAAENIANTAVNQMKPRVEKSGAMGGPGGMLAVQTPYLILTRPRQCLPENQNTFTGYPSLITENLEDLSGYTEIEEIHLENVSATGAECDEIIQILKSGVIF